MILLGIDTGGTFTDFVLVKRSEDSDKTDTRFPAIQKYQLTIHKVLSTPHAPEKAILQGIDDLGLGDSYTADLLIVHGSTVATNAVLEGKVARTVYIANRGMKDILTLGRQSRKELYNLQPMPVAPPVAEEFCLETGGRMSARGEELEPLSSADLEHLSRQIKDLSPESVAINLLFSFLDDRHEKAIEAIVPENVFVSRSSEVLPEIREYERGITTWLNASVGPVVNRYLNRLTDGINQRFQQNQKRRINISVMQSSGGTIDGTQAAKQAVHMLLSGPAGGMAGARYVAACSGKTRLLTFDMGGTSTDVALIDGELKLTSEGSIGNYPVAVPMVDMHTIGAGGGSIASIDEGGLLQVGPQSAGAEPGPACYRQGGKFATVTDANLAESFLGGAMTLDVEAARHVIEPLAGRLNLSPESMAEGIIELANEHMARALRVMSVQRGIDPRQLTLVSFGGAGGLHVCALAEALAMKQAIVPVNAGVLSALGMLVAPRARHLSQSYNVPIDVVKNEELITLFATLHEQGSHALLQEGVTRNDIIVDDSVDVRYQGQSYSLNIPWQGKQKTLDNFHELHEQRYGHQLDQPVEIVTVRVVIKAKSEMHDHFETLLAKGSAPVIQDFTEAKIHGYEQPVRVYSRENFPPGQKLTGPLLITEKVSTTYVQVGWSCHVDQVGNLLLVRD